MGLWDLVNFSFSLSPKLTPSLFLPTQSFHNCPNFSLHIFPPKKKWCNAVHVHVHCKTLENNLIFIFNCDHCDCVMSMNFYKTSDWMYGYNWRATCFWIKYKTMPNTATQEQLVSRRGKARASPLPFSRYTRPSVAYAGKNIAVKFLKISPHPHPWILFHEFHIVPLSFLFWDTASNHKLDSGKAWEQGYFRFLWWPP